MVTIHITQGSKTYIDGAVPRRVEEGGAGGRDTSTNATFAFGPHRPRPSPPWGDPRRASLDARSSWEGKGWSSSPTCLGVSIRTWGCQRLGFTLRLQAGADDFWNIAPTDHSFGMAFCTLGLSRAWSDLARSCVVSTYAHSIPYMLPFITSTSSLYPVGSFASRRMDRRSTRVRFHPFFQAPPSGGATDTPAHPRGVG